MCDKCGDTCCRLERHEERTDMPRLPSKTGSWEGAAPKLKALIVEHGTLPGDAWTEYCDLVNDNHDLKLLLAEQEVKIARLQAGQDLYKSAHAHCVRRLNVLDPPSDL